MIKKIAPSYRELNFYHKGTLFEESGRFLAELLVFYSIFLKTNGLFSIRIYSKSCFR